MTPDPIADYYVAERRELVDFAHGCGPFGTAIDIGCASGVLGDNLQRGGIVETCDGIEPFAEAARLASGRLHQVWHGTFESVFDSVSWQQYDLVVMADVMEHLVDPWTALRRLHAGTAQTCRLLLSVPNVRHYKVSMPLLFRGEFRYTDQGIMDRTHLHFFTRNSLEETLRECGWKILHVGSHMKKRYRRLLSPTRLLEPFVAVQYFLVAEKQ